MIEKCIDTLRRVTAYRDYEIICIENIPPSNRKKWRGWLRSNTIRVISTNEAFNWARFNNLAAAHARAYLCSSTTISKCRPRVAEALLSEAQRRSRCCRSAPLFQIGGSSTPGLWPQSPRPATPSAMRPRTTRDISA
jgi:hypothetical protein